MTVNDYEMTEMESIGELLINIRAHIKKAQKHNLIKPLGVFSIPTNALTSPRQRIPLYVSSADIDQERR